MSESPERERRTELVRQLAARIPNPVSVMELAAVIESIGINDAIAREDFGCEGVFDLAEHLFPLVIRAAQNRRQSGETWPDVGPADPPLDKMTLSAMSARGALAFAPLVLLMTTIAILSRAGWSLGSVLALSIGGSIAMMMTAGPVLAAGRRTAIYLGFGYRSPARRFLSLASLATFGGCVAVAAVALVVGWAADLFTADDRRLFALGLVSVALLWLLVSCLTLTGSTTLAMVVLVIGLGAGLATGFAFGTSVGLAIGYGVSTTLLLVLWIAGDITVVTWPLPLPALGPLAVEAAPYAAFGFLYAFLLLEPHLLGWAARTSEDRLDALITLELSITLALPPLLLVSGFHERNMLSFWRSARDLQHVSDATRFNQALSDLFKGRMTSYGIALAAFSLVWTIGIEVAHHLGAFGPLSQLVFLLSVGSFWFIGIAQFTCLFLLGIARPQGAVVATYVGIAAIAASGIPLAFVDFRLPIIAFGLGAGAFAIVGFTNSRKALKRADHKYATAF